MPEYQYTVVPGKLKDLLQKIREIGVPPKVSLKWLESIGFASSNDRGMLPVLEQIGFLDSSDAPTDRWKNYRGDNHRKVLAEGIVFGYPDLYNVYPNAHARTPQELEGFFSTRSSAGRQVITKIVGTFRNLCELADFSGVPTDSDPMSRKLDIKAIQIKDIPESKQEHSSFSPKVHIDVQIHISPDTTPEQIDQIFASMAKHLYKPRE